MIEVRHLYKSFGAVEVLHDINVKFAKGKVSQIIGKSGSGKSVLAKCIIGLYKPTKGEVLYDGRSFQEMDKEATREINEGRLASRTLNATKNNHIMAMIAEKCPIPRKLPASATTSKLTAVRNKGLILSRFSA